MLESFNSPNKRLAEEAFGAEYLDLDDRSQRTEFAYNYSALIIRSIYTAKSITLDMTDLPPEPLRWKDIIGHRYEAEFRKATDLEYEKTFQVGTWTVVSTSDMPTGTKPLPLTWVWKYKLNERNEVTKFKARICARGDLQSTGFDTYAATLSTRLFRLIMGIICFFDLETIQMDAINAFLNAKLPEPIYLQLPDGYRQSGKVLKCTKAIYGLRESPLLWYTMLKGTL